MAFKMFQKSACVMLLLLSLIGCAGRAANPVTINQFGDDQKSCPAIKSELKTIENNIQRLIPETNKTGKNVALGITGLIVFPAWFFMDLSNAEKEEVNAYRARHDRLVTIAEIKKCQLENAA